MFCNSVSGVRSVINEVLLPLEAIMEVQYPFTLRRPDCPGPWNVVILRVSSYCILSHFPIF